MSEDHNKNKKSERVKIPGLIGIENISEEKWKSIFHHFRIGEHLLQRKYISIGQLSDLLEEQKNTGEHLGEIVIRKGYITREGLLELLHWQHKADKVIMELLINIDDKEDEKDKNISQAE